MPNYRRKRVPGGIVFLTIVAHQRYPLFDDQNARRFLRESILGVWRQAPFDLFAICLLPDHLHTVWCLPPGDSDYSGRVEFIKKEFTKSWLASGGWEGHRSHSRIAKRERAVWQRRFWEHTVRDENDLRRCVDYLHWNPRKHDLVNRIKDYPFSTFHQFVAKGEYTEDWGGTDPVGDWNAAEFVGE